MIDLQRGAWPADMKQANSFPQEGTLEHFFHDALGQIDGYARANPAAFGLWALGIGFVLGWKLKPW
ncbi:MAG: hypothetical protein U0794_13635 [Isosphaeraceae bacterium]